MGNPIFYHIDVNSAFLSWESLYRLTLDPDGVDYRKELAVIGGDESMRHGIVLAKSTPAKKYDIQTGESLSRARQKCPGIIVLTPHYEQYVIYSKAFISILERFSPVVEQYSIDEAFCDMTGTELLYGSDYVALAHKIKDIIYHELGFTVNIGVSNNRLLAKMASDFQKPDRVHTLFPEEIEQKMWPLPIEDLFFAGASSCATLKNLGIRTIGDLAKADFSMIQAHMKKHGELLYHYAHGEDLDSLKPSAVANKGYSNETTLSTDVTDRETARLCLLSLCETVGYRIRADKALVSVVSVVLVDSDFKHSSHQRKLLSPTDSTQIIYQEILSLFDECWNHNPIRLLGVSTSQASFDGTKQLNLFDLEKSEKLTKLDNAIDSIRKKFGEDSIMRASFADSNTNHMTKGLNRAKRESNNQS